MWVYEASELGPSLESQPQSAHAAPAEFASLAKPLDRSIDRLEVRELGELAQEPQRDTLDSESAPPELARLLAALQGRTGTAARTSGTPAPKPGCRPAAAATRDVAGRTGGTVEVLRARQRRERSLICPELF